MCGILGTNDSVSTIGEARVRESIVHRGPDSYSTYCSEDVGLLISRLSIINAESDDQPVNGCDDRFTAIFNGEIYNYKQLSKELELSGHRFPEAFSDAAIIPHLLEEYGKEFVTKIDGMFAIAIWDKIEKEIILYRDILGIKPLYYFVKDGKISFSSEIRSLLEILNFEPKIEFASLQEFSSSNLISSPFTFYKDIYSLEPGTYLQVNQSSSTIRRWATNTTSRVNIKKTTNLDLAIDELEELLIESVSDQVSHGNSNALLLSGGLDSSLIAHILKKCLNKEIETYHLAYETKITRKSVETIMARKIANELDYNLNVITMDSKTYFNQIDAALDSFSQPFGGVTSTYFVSSEIAKENKVCLTGDGADELFGSYRNIQRAAKIFYGRELNSAVEHNLIEKGLEEFLNMSIISADNADSANHIHHKSREDLLNLKEELNIFDFALLYDQLKLLPDQVLLFSDHLGMAHSLEIRPPFLSKKIIEFSRKLPREFLIDRSGTTKKILKGLGLRYFDSNFVLREKEGFLLPLEEWFSTTEAKIWVHNKLYDYKNSNNKIINISSIEIFINRYYEGFHNDFFRLYRMATLMHFLKNHD
jgi:asparagine synthase (glutamine-hydrolysing)